MKLKALLFSTLLAVPLVLNLQDAQAANITYDINVATSSKSDAGTDSNIDITIVGEGQFLNEFGPFRLDDPNKDEFEAGNIDTFRITIPDPGIIRYIKVHSDGSGHKPGWMPSYISIKDPNGSITQYFYYKGKTYIGENGAETVNFTPY